MIVDLLEKKITENECIVALQEVMPSSAEVITRRLSDRFNIIYSLTLREPGKFDTDNRKLGVMYLVSKDTEVLANDVLPRAVFPERTLHITISDKNKRIYKLLNVHSLTGVSFKMAKAVQFRAYAEYVNDLKPDIVSFDANEPKKDHFEVSQMEFFDQGQGENGKSARLFFEELVHQGLRDVYAEKYDKDKFIDGEPLTVSHVIGSNNAKRRYDFIFAKNDLEILDARYLYEEATNASSDHAMVIADIT